MVYFDRPSKPPDINNKKIITIQLSQANTPTYLNPPRAPISYSKIGVYSGVHNVTYNRRSRAPILYSKTGCFSFFFELYLYALI